MTNQFKIDKSIALEEAQIMQKALEEAHIEQEGPEEAQVPENCEISVSYVQKGEKRDRNNIVINNIFAFQVAFDIIRNDEDTKQRNVEECRHRNDWPKMERSYTSRVKLINKTRSFLTCSPNT